MAHVLARVRPGPAIPLHPWYPVRAISRAAVPLLIDGLRARGYRVTTVGELLARNTSGRSDSTLRLMSAGSATVAMLPAGFSASAVQ